MRLTSKYEIFYDEQLWFIWKSHENCNNMKAHCLYDNNRKVENFLKVSFQKSGILRLPTQLLRHWVDLQVESFSFRLPSTLRTRIHKTNATSTNENLNWQSSGCGISCQLIPHIFISIFDFYWLQLHLINYIFKFEESNVYVLLLKNTCHFCRMNYSLI